MGQRRGSLHEEYPHPSCHPCTERDMNAKKQDANVRARHDHAACWHVLLTYLRTRPDATTK